MKKSAIIYCTFLLLSCSNSNDSTNLNLENQAFATRDTLTTWQFRNTESKNEKLQLTTDINGDGQLDTLQERYVNHQTMEEIGKIDFVICSYQDCVDSFIKSNQPRAFIEFLGKNDTLFLDNHAPNYPSFGLTAMLDVGNINVEKGNEIAVINAWAKFAGGTNYCSIYSFQNGWKLIHEFDYHDDQIRHIISRESKLNLNENNINFVMTLLASFFKLRTLFFVIIMLQKMEEF